MGWQNKYINPGQGIDKSTGNFRPKIGVVPPVGLGGVKCLPKPSTFSSKHTLKSLVARYVTAGDGGGSVAASNSLRVNVYTPSNRLRIAIYATIEPDTTNLDVVYQAGNENTWSITSMARNPDTGKEIAMQNAYPATGTKNLPDAYEADSAIELLRVNLTLKHNAFSTTYVAATERLNVNVVCTWEPNVPMGHDEFMELCAKCSISFGQPTLIQNDAV